MSGGAKKLANLKLTQRSSFKFRMLNKTVINLNYFWVHKTNTP